MLLAHGGTCIRMKDDEPSGPRGTVLERADARQRQVNMTNPFPRSSCPAVFPAHATVLRSLHIYSKMFSCKSNGTAHFTGNPHVAAPSMHDLELSVPIPHATFPIPLGPLPPYLPRSAPLSALVAPTRTPKKATQGNLASPSTACARRSLVVRSRA